MLVVNKTVKLLLGSGALLLLLWVALLAFSATSMDATTQTSKPFKQPHFSKRKEVEPVLNSPWRTVSLQQFSIPEDAKRAAKNITPVLTNYVVKTLNTSVLSLVPPNPTSKLTFLFLHGAAFTASDWHELGTMGLLGALGYKSFAVDLPGFGLTKTPLGIDKETFMSKVEYFSLLVDMLESDKLILVAPSMSGNYALPYVLTKSDKIAGLVPIAPAASGIVPRSKLMALKVPTLLIYGSKDTSLGATSHKDLKVIPNFQAVVLPEAGHAAYLDQPEQFHSLLYNFARIIESGL